MTLEAFPSERNYQHLGDVFNRPTLSELVDGKGGADAAKDPEKGDEDKASKRYSPLTSHLTSYNPLNLQVPEGKVIKFGWVEGVFMRCLLNIWGTMLFLR